MSQTIKIIPRDVADRSYDVRVGISLKTAGKEIRDRYPRSLLFVITDSNVARLYLKAFIQSIPEPGLPLNSIVIPPGETSKSRRMKENIENAVISLGADRSSVILALGGGVVGDISGFVAATLFRGIPYIQIPTSLLAQVDSSVGGKVGIDHPRGKNLIGAFHQPDAVYADLSTLRTLPDAEFRSGLAEVLKYAMILDKDLFEYLERHPTAILRRNIACLEHCVTRCCEIKRRVVRADERESDFRRILNFGHTIGHAVEAVSKFRIRHGEGVSIGMVAESKIAVASGLMKEPDARRLYDLLRVYRLPVALPAKVSLRSVISATDSDKKRREGVVEYTLPERIGRARTGIAVPADSLYQILNR